MKFVRLLLAALLAFCALAVAAPAQAATMPVTVPQPASVELGGTATIRVTTRSAADCYLGSRHRVTDSSGRAVWNIPAPSPEGRYGLTVKCKKGNAAGQASTVLSVWRVRARGHGDGDTGPSITFGLAGTRRQITYRWNCLSPAAPFLALTWDSSAFESVFREGLSGSGALNIPAVSTGRVEVVTQSDCTWSWVGRQQ